MVGETHMCSEEGNTLNDIERKDYFKIILTSEYKKKENPWMQREVTMKTCKGSFGSGNT